MFNRNHFILLIALALLVQGCSSGPTTIEPFKLNSRIAAAPSASPGAWPAVVEDEPAHVKNDCDTSCSKDATFVYKANKKDKCELNFVFSCFPYACDADGKFCGTGCKGDKDCAVGAVCNVSYGRCTTVGTLCYDPYTVIQTDGVKQSCLPYKCAAGNCQQQCTKSSECSSGYKCKKGHCE